MTVASAGNHRVLQLVSRDDVGGVRVLSRMIEKGLREHGVEVDNLALLAPGGPIRKMLHVGKVVGRIATGRYDAILAHHAAASVATGILGTLVGTPVRVSHLSAIPEAIRGHWRVFDRALGALGAYTAIVSNSLATTDAFSAYPSRYRQRIRLVAHGVSPLLEGVQHMDWRTRLGVPPGAKLLVATGRLTSQKGFDCAVEALGDLPEVHLAIAGDGPERTRLLALAAGNGAAERFHLPGSVDHAELREFLLAGDIYLFPSVWETFGLAGAEALIAGMPIVASDLPVLREVLGDAGAAPGMVRYHAAGDAGGLALAVRTTLDDYPAPAARSRSAASARAHHSVERMIGKYLELLDGQRPLT
ncbi:MAG: glycosyltransferase family 4 protein [Rhodobiaceae bacterium]|nr:glycosyltransferase family 4 protein [Rhodobiaceae bacterium]MCC0055241.1 glycosyltransferase family 4 protein [Rhodobiaceae bacterium]